MVKIIVNADDFGFSKSCSKAILKAFELNYITTTTACANGDYFDEAVEEIKAYDYVNNVGLHVNLTEGEPLTDGIKQNRLFCDSEGKYIGFPFRYKKLSGADKSDVYNEVCAQIKKYKETGLSIHHLDSHHHIHNAPNIFPIIMHIAKENGIDKIRLFRNIGEIPLYKKIIKGVYNNRLKQFAYSKYMGSFEDLNFVKDEDCVLELMTHPDYTKEGLLVDRLNDDYSNPTGTPFQDINDYLKKRKFVVQN